MAGYGIDQFNAKLFLKPGDKAGPEGGIPRQGLRVDISPGES
jgi:hypothetical protein